MKGSKLEVGWVTIVKNYEEKIMMRCCAIVSRSHDARAVNNCVNANSIKSFAR